MHIDYNRPQNLKRLFYYVETRYTKYRRWQIRSQVYIYSFRSSAAFNSLFLFISVHFWSSCFTWFVL